jgi:diguanylate cyclase (GGDEF)-like protein
MADGNGTRILLVEDDELSRDVLARRLARRGYEVVAVASAAEGLDRAQAEAFDLVLLDWMMPGMNGLEMLDRLRARATPSELPVIMVTARAESEAVVQALEHGANDYVTKPVQLDIAVARINTHVALKRGEERIRREATVDPLTGLYNRRHLMERMEQELVSARRYGHPLTCCVLDLDRYKEINDRHGHRAGDEVLAAVGRLLREQVRCTDLAARYGGDELVVLFPHTDATGACHLAERLLRHLRAQRFVGPNGTFGVSASVGIAEVDASTRTAADLIEAADRALYQAKRAGRDRIVFAEPDPVVVALRR